MLYHFDNRGRRSVYSPLNSTKVSQWILFRPRIGPLVQQWGLAKACPIKFWFLNNLMVITVYPSKLITSIRERISVLI